MIALERHVKAIAQDILGVALVNPEARQFRLVHQNPAHVAPEEACKRAVRVRLPVGELMMPAVYRHPARGRFLQTGHRDHHHGVFQPFGTFQAAMGEEPMIAKVDAKQPAQVGAERRDEETGPAEIARHKGQQRRDMVGADDDDVEPVELERPHASRQQQPRNRSDRSRVIRGGQYRSLYGGRAYSRHREVGIPISAPDAAAS